MDPNVKIFLPQNAKVQNNSASETYFTEWIIHRMMFN